MIVLLLHFTVTMHWVTVATVLGLTQLNAVQSSSNDDNTCENNVPENCNFGSDFCGWDEHNWTQARNRQGNYTVLENRKSAGYIKSQVRCVSSPISHCLWFRFYLQKSYENTLDVSIMWPRNKTEVLLWSYSTNTRWIIAAVPVVTGSSFALIIRGRRKNLINNRQLGVDNIDYRTHRCTLIPSPDGVKCENTVPKNCSFGSDFCGWKENNWTRHTNTKYVFLDDGKPSGHITSKVRCVESPNTHCLTFRFYLQSNDKSTLSVSIAWPHNKSESLLWIYSTNASWKDAAVPVESESNFALIIRARRPHAGDNSKIRVDNIVYTTQRCSLQPPSVEPSRAATTERPTTSRTPTITAKSKEKASASINREKNMNTTCIYSTQTTNTIDITSLSSGTLGDPASSAKVGMIVGVVTAIVALIVIVVIGLAILRRMRLRASHRKPKGDTNHGEKSENNTQANSTETRTTAGQDVNLTHANNGGELYVNQCHNTQRSSTSSAHNYRDSEGYEIPCTRQGNTQHTTISSLRTGKTQHIKSINPRHDTAVNPSYSEQHGIEVMPGAQNNKTSSRGQTRDKTNVIPTGCRDISSYAHSSDVYEISPDRENEQTRHNTDFSQLQEQEARTAKRTSTRTYDILDFTNADKERRVYADLGTTSPALQAGDGASLYEALQVNTDIHVYRELPGLDKN